MKGKIIWMETLLVLLSVTAAHTSVPPLMNYQGKLTDEYGVPVPDGNYSIQFRIYTDSIGGDVLWEELQWSVPVSAGLFSVLLGSAEDIPDTAFIGTTRWLGVQVSPDPELSPRKPIITMAYAFRSAKTDTADYALKAPRDNDWEVDTSGFYVYRMEGGVGIGTVIPESKLEVVGTAQMTGFKMPTGAAEGYVLTSDGSGVGIWQVTGPTGFADSARVAGKSHLAYQAEMADSAMQAVYADTADYALSALPDADWVINGNIIYHMDGNVGIGTVSPGDELDVNGDIRVRGANIKDAGGTTRITLAHGGRLDLKEDGGSTALSIATNGNVGIGMTSPGDKLDVNGDIRVRGSDIKDAGGTTRITLTDDGRLDLKEDGGSAALSIATNGNVGIGTTSPAEKLHVNGRSILGNLNFYPDPPHMEIKLGVSGDLHIMAGESELGAPGGRLSLVSGAASCAFFSEGNVGICVSYPSNILTVEQNSGTDPVADGWTTYSSRRWKTNIEPISKALEKVKKLRGVYFDWEQNSQHDIGMIAEEVGEVVPEAVAYEENGRDAKSVDYGRLVALLVEAVKEQQREIDMLGEEINAMKRGVSR